jgi:hypothetical protein
VAGARGAGSRCGRGYPPESGGDGSATGARREDGARVVERRRAVGGVPAARAESSGGALGEGEERERGGSPTAGRMETTRARRRVGGARRALAARWGREEREQGGSPAVGRRWRPAAEKVGAPAAGRVGGRWRLWRAGGKKGN